MKLKRPNAYLFGGQMLGSGTGQPIIPKETIGPQLDTAVQIGSGPYIGRLEQPRPRRTTSTRRTPTYWGRKQGSDPYRQRVEVTYILDKSAQETAFYGGQLDYFVPSPEQMKTAKSRLPDAHFYRAARLLQHEHLLQHVAGQGPALADGRPRPRGDLAPDRPRGDRSSAATRAPARSRLGLLPTSLKPYQVDPKDVAQYTTA